MDLTSPSVEGVPETRFYFRLFSVEGGSNPFFSTRKKTFCQLRKSTEIKATYKVKSKATKFGVNSQRGFGVVDQIGPGQFQNGFNALEFGYFAKIEENNLKKNILTPAVHEKDRNVLIIFSQI